eukprot:GHVH01016332.1.p1 GENE.GHVH01016332.1~~GHVH01016332.1.p1  ORF type:complete len:240 (-),score=32.54 GHVH01016332.1:84-803(-)
MAICSPLESLSDAVQQYGIIDSEGNPLPGFPPVTDLSLDWDNVVLYPCGLQAFSLFNDTFSLHEYDDESLIPLYDDPDLICTAPDRKLFKSPTGDYADVPVDKDGGKLVYNWIPKFFYDDNAGNGVENSHFMNWMRLSPTKELMKLYGTLDENGSDIAVKLPFKVKVRNRYNVDGWGGKKYIHFHVNPTIGPVTDTNTNIFIFLGCVSLVIFIVFTIKHNLTPRRQGDIRYIGGEYKHN